MSEKSPSKDEALEALDFIVNVLKEHEKDLDRLVSELGNVAGQLGESGELNGKVKKIEDKVNSIQSEVGFLVKNFAAPPQEMTFGPINATTANTNDKIRNAIQNHPAQTAIAQPNPASNANPNINSNPNPKPPGVNALPNGMPLTLQCSQWEDFQALSNQAQALSYRVRENEKVMDITAIKNNQIITYTGQPPNQSSLIKTWISKQLNVSEKQILEGNIAPR